MDAKDRLRRYLEQRRELGESELVLDAMSVDDLMSMIGAKNLKSAQKSAPVEHAELVAPIAPVVAEVVQVAPAPQPSVRFDASVTSNWREVLGQPTTASESIAAPTPKALPLSRRIDVHVPTWLSALELPMGLHVVHAAADDHAAQLASHVTTLKTLDEVAESARQCTRCALHSNARHAVPGEGNPLADFVCVGEAPGASEDEQGRPFVGEAGELLTKILGAIQLERNDVFICNVLKHRPPMNRDPLPDEVHACQPYLLRQLELIKPRVILALGRFAAQTLLQTVTPIGKLRGQLHAFHGIPLIVTYHPAALLRNEAWKRPTWDDVKLARRVLDASRAESLRNAASE